MAHEVLIPPKVAAEIAGASGHAVAVAGDVSEEASCSRMIAEAERRLGGLDTLFNNAGVVLPGDNDATDTPLAVWEKTLAVDLTGVFLCCKFGIPALLRAGGGAIVNNASMVALVGSAFPQIAYTAAKGGVVAMTRELAVVYQPIVSLRTGRLRAFEVLSRWNHPEEGTLAPELFIPIAEESDLIARIDSWATAEAVRQAGIWNEGLEPDDRISVSVNASARQIRKPGLAA